MSFFNNITTKIQYLLFIIILKIYPYEINVNFMLNLLFETFVFKYWHKFNIVLTL
jgi:hypothetical protein